MPTNDEVTFGLYLRGLLATGARPFAHRGSVYRLLGRPAPQGIAMGFPPPLPPVGFVYEQLAWFREMPALGGAPLPTFPPSREPNETPERVEEDASIRPRSTPPAPDAARPDVEKTAVRSPIVPHSPSGLPLSMRTGERVKGGEAVPPSLTSLGASLDEAPGGMPPARPLDAAGPLGEAPRVTTPSLVPPPVEAPLNAAGKGGTGVPSERVGLAIPGLTQRRSAFAALAGADAGGVDSFAVSSVVSSAVSSVAPPPRVTPPILSAPPSAPSPIHSEGASGLRARTSIAEEVKRVRRTVTAPGPQRMVREVVEEAARKAVREEASRLWSGESPSRHAASVLAPVVVVQPASADVQRVPRAFWSSSALRSTHLRRLR